MITQRLSLGVPQGSVLGPLMFLCYINNMEISADSDCKLLLYVDDSAIIYFYKDQDEVSKKLACVIDSCYKWFQAFAAPGENWVCCFWF